MTADGASGGHPGERAGRPAGPPAPPTSSVPVPGDAPSGPSPGGRDRLRPRRRWPLGWVVAALVALPASLGGFWLARDSGAARPLCGDRPGRHYPACQLPPPWGTGAPPTTTGFTP